MSRVQLSLASAVAGAIAAGAFAVAGVALVIAVGWYDVAASKEHRAIVAWIVHTTMIQSVHHHATRTGVPASFSSGQVSEGFKLYDSHCVECHGGPGISRAHWVTGINPPPPYLLDAARHWTPAELRFIIGHGVKMTAMPAWRRTFSAPQLMDLTAFIEKLPDIMPDRYMAMRRGAAESEAGAVASARPVREDR